MNGVREGEEEEQGRGGRKEEVVVTSEEEEEEEETSEVVQDALTTLTLAPAADGWLWCSLYTPPGDMHMLVAEEGVTLCRWPCARSVCFFLCSFLHGLWLGLGLGVWLRCSLL